jgi:acyl carrier protein
LHGSPAQVAVASIRWSAFLGRFAAPPPFLEELATATSATIAARTHTAKGPGRVRAALASATPSRQQDIVLDYVQSHAEVVLGIGSALLSPRTPLSELGLDSLMAVELRNRLGQGLELSQPLPATLVFDYPTVEAISKYLAEAVLGIVEPAAAPSEPAETPSKSDGALLAAMLENLEMLSDQEVDRLLASRAGQRE